MTNQEWHELVEDQYDRWFGSVILIFSKTNVPREVIEDAFHTSLLHVQENLEARDGKSVGETSRYIFVSTHNAALDMLLKVGGRPGAARFEPLRENMPAPKREVRRVDAMAELFVTQPELVSSAFEKGRGNPVRYNRAAAKKKLAALLEALLSTDRYQDV